MIGYVFVRRRVSDDLDLLFLCLHSVDAEIVLSLLTMTMSFSKFVLHGNQSKQILLLMKPPCLFPHPSNTSVFTSPIDEVLIFFPSSPLLLSSS